MKTIIIDLDDFRTTAENLDLLVRMKEHFPDLKITAFTIPIDPNLVFGKIDKKKVFEWAELAKTLDWIEIAVHGIAHTQNEWNLTDNRKIEKMVDLMEKAFNDLKLPFKKIFKAPYWQLSKQAGRILRKRGYKIAEDRNQQRLFKDSYVYNWSLDEPIIEADIIKAHGHIDGESKNALDRVFLKIINELPQDAEFKFISEVI